MPCPRLMAVAVGQVDISEVGRGGFERRADGHLFDVHVEDIGHGFDIEASGKVCEPQGVGNGNADTVLIPVDGFDQDPSAHSICMGSDFTETVQPQLFVLFGGAPGAAVWREKSSSPIDRHDDQRSVQIRSEFQESLYIVDARPNLVRIGIDEPAAMPRTHGRHRYSFRKGGLGLLDHRKTFELDAVESVPEGVLTLFGQRLARDESRLGCELHSVEDPESVDPRYGSWSDIETIAGRTRLMVDAVVNHLSSTSQWFQGFLDGEPKYEGFFRTATPDTDLSETVRPRTHPLLTHFEGATNASVWVWTTFSTDQVDLDFRNPRVLIRTLSVILDYAKHGVSAIRLDAIAYLWKEEGTPSIHLPQTHAIVQLIRQVLDATYPHVLVITETNVPHEENVSYFGAYDTREADGVYLFTLAPLTLHALTTGDVEPLERWLAHLAPGPPPDRAYLTFLASHDGVGVRPAEGWLSPADIDSLVKTTLGAGGQVSYRTTPDGRSPYEINCTWFDLMAAGTDESTAIDRHVASHAIMLALPGIPLIYVHSLLGSSNDHRRYARDGFPRALNRGRLRFDQVLAELDNPTTRASMVLDRLKELIGLRAEQPQFHPDVPFRVLDTPPGVIGIERTPTSGPPARVYVDVSGAGAAVLVDGDWHSLFGEPPVRTELTLSAFGTAWLEGRDVPRPRSG